MAQVYRARRVGPVGFRKEVAIKRLRQAMIGRDDAMREALVNEARNGGLLRHPGIVEIYEFDRVGDEWYLAMEFVQGWTLDEVLWRAVSGDVPPELLAPGGGALSTPVVLDLVRQVAEALAHAHEATDEQGTPLRLVHRDLKPANVFLDHRGTIKLADFGLAKSRANVRQTTDADRTKGSPLYMSPEQVLGEVLDGRSDLFALGTLVVEMCTGRAPFEGDTVANTLLKVMGVDWAEVEPAMAQAAPLLNPVAHKLLQKDRALRYSSARSLAEDLSRLASRRPVGEFSALLAQGLREGATTTPPPDDALGARRTALQSVVAVTPGGGWGLLVALLLLLGLLLVAFVVVLRAAPRGGADFESVSGPSAEALGDEDTPEAALLAPPAPSSGEQVLHRPPQEAQLWQDLELLARPVGPGPWVVRANYRVGASSWRSIDVPCADGECRALVPITSSARLEYWIEATGPSDARWTMGSAEAPIPVTVR